VTPLSEVAEGMQLSPSERTPDSVDLFLYSAAVWLPHRIHYDAPYTTGGEGHPGLLVQGPLQGVYLMQLLTASFGDGVRVVRFVFRHQTPVYVGQTLRCQGQVRSVDRAAGEVVCELWTELDDGTRATVAEALLRLPEDAA
jgi:hydroxyacyl-ACP dehydratase HTD2-like protein with hotdog domain